MWSVTRPALFVSLSFAVASPIALGDEPPAAPAPPAAGEIRAACGADVQKLCAGVQPGGGRIIACLKEHKDEVSDGCKQALMKNLKKTA